MRCQMLQENGICFYHDKEGQWVHQPKESGLKCVCFMCLCKYNFNTKSGDLLEESFDIKFLNFKDYC